MPPPASYAAPAPPPRKNIPNPSEELVFDIEPPAQEPPASSPIPEDSPGGEDEKAEYGLGKPRCPNCKAELAHGSQFCVECGTSLATGTKVTAAATASPAKKKGVEVDGEMAKKILVGLLLAAALAIGGYSAYKYLYEPWRLTHPSASAPAEKVLRMQKEERSHGSPAAPAENPAK
jgi:hypothetical protein